MTHRKHAAALLTAVLLLALTACGRQTAAASDPAQTPAAPAVETPVITAPAVTPTPAGKDAGSDGWKAKFERSLLEDYGVTPDHYEDLGNGIYQVYVKIDGKWYISTLRFKDTLVADPTKGWKDELIQEF